jgi:hypoxanthine phosphoribosyltransferase
LNLPVIRILIGPEELQAGVARLGRQITEDYREKDLVLVGILKGSVFFLADLARAIPLPLEVGFMGISSYGAATETSGVVRVTQDLDIRVEGRDILIVEDIVDSGLTLNRLLSLLSARDPRSLRVCALLDKPARRRAGVPLAYVGFPIEDAFVVGYGLDLDQKYRNLPYIGVISGDQGSGGG